MLTEFADMAEYIRGTYLNKKIIEVGIGRRPEIAIRLSDMDLTVTDVFEPEFMEQYRSIMKFAKDDIFAPNIDIYRNAALIYSIRPPVDLFPAIAAVASEVGADLIIRPFASERIDVSRYFKINKIINYGKARFWLFSR